MRTVKCHKFILVILVAFISTFFISTIVTAQAIKTSVSEILKNPDKYDGKMVQAEGTVGSLRSKTSKKGNPYTTLMIRDSSNGVLNVFSFGTLSVKKNDSVVVTGRYQKIKHVGSFTFYNEIDASEGSVEKSR
jgi:hypothetical protein